MINGRITKPYGLFRDLFTRMAPDSAKVEADTYGDSCGSLLSLAYHSSSLCVETAP
jgi:hypothetical protein